MAGTDSSAVMECEYASVAQIVAESIRAPAETELDEVERVSSFVQEDTGANAHGMRGPLFEVGLFGNVICLCSSTLEKGGDEIGSDEGCGTLFVSKNG